MEKLRITHPECDNYISRVTVKHADGPGHWIVETKERPGISVPTDCTALKAPSPIDFGGNTIWFRSAAPRTYDQRHDRARGSLRLISSVGGVIAVHDLAPSIAVRIAAWTVWSCAATAAVSDKRRCRVS